MPAGIFIGNMGKHHGKRIPCVQILDPVKSVHLHAGGHGNLLLQDLVDIKILHMSVLTDLPHTVQGQKAGTGGAIRNAAADAHGILHPKRDVVTSMGHGADTVKAFKFFHESTILSDYLKLCHILGIFG